MPKKRDVPLPIIKDEASKEDEVTKEKTLLEAGLKEEHSKE